MANWHGVDHVIGNMVAEVKKTQVGLAAYASMIAAPRLEADAKANAPWHDISGNARRGLKGGVMMRGENIIIYLAHTVDYGPYLELAHDRKYQIIDRTIEKNLPQIKAGYTRIMHSAGGR